MRKDDLIRVRHMLDAAKEAVSFVHNRTRAGLSIKTGCWPYPL